jgi:LuxR family maltose regulon positive regulatory protein
MAAHADARLVDTAADASLSFAPLDRPVEREQPAAPRSDLPTPDRSSDARSRRRRPRILVEAGRPAIVAGSFATTGGHLGMTEYPVQLSKVQAPPLREETLARDRLLEWLSVKIHRRVVLLIAEAGYGKTTLLADFSRRTRLRMLWFRLDRGDRDWVGFLAHLVAAVRIHVPEFGASTSSLLRETATASPSLDTVLDTFLRELGGLPNEPSALVFDDFHLVDDAADVRHVLRELLTRGPERLSYVFASRREPPLRLARLRALGEVAELKTDDLRFDATETERLFRDTYAMRLEPAILAELRRRTEGWAASLQLVRSALHDRDPGQVRAFITSLSGAEGHLYEYLAEEVVGELPAELQQFLMRTSVLETVDLTLGPVAAGIDRASTQERIEEGEREGLFGKGGAGLRHVVRAHPLVRDFLQDRLRRSIGEDGVRTINLRVARAAEPVDWRIAGRHYVAGGAEGDARRVLAGAIENVLATGAYAAAQELASSLTSGGLAGAPGLVLESRLAQQRAAVDEGLALAEQAWALEPDSTAVLLTLIAARTLVGDVAGALDAGRLLEQATRSEFAALGRAYQRVMETSVSGSLEVAIRELKELSVTLRARGETHYLGVALLNLAYIRAAMGDPELALADADDAIAELAAASSGMELVSARLARAVALAQLGDIEAARAEAEVASRTAAPGQALELAIEIGQMEALYGEATRAIPLFEHVAAELTPDTDNGEQGVYAALLVEVANHDPEAPPISAPELRFGEPRSSMAFEARRHLALGLVFSLANDPRAQHHLDVGLKLARSQHAHLWESYGSTLAALANRDADPSFAVLRVGRDQPVVLSMLAEMLVLRVRDLAENARGLIRDEALRRPWRWRPVVRRLLRSKVADENQFAAALLETIGEAEDVRRLRDASRQLRDRRNARLGYRLARRLAQRVSVEDLGRIRIRSGDRIIEGGEIRRKVLALLCLLLSRPRFSSTREEVVESLWPELDPSAALNSLNQTVYFLRRVFEPDYVEDLSPGYVGQDGETIWLDQELVDGQSRRCLEIIRATTGPPTPEASLALANLYVGRFALDFAYEDWSAAYRDALHAGYLRVIEHAIRIDLDTGHFSRGTYLAERAIEVDPEAEEIQAALVRLYRLSGAYAAAAEQYGHYADALTELGVQPLPFSEI